jgi:hypothetical protein
MARTRLGPLALAALTASWLALGMGAVWAHHKSGHEQGGGNGGGNAQKYSVTEDNDGDGHANVPDPQGNSDNAHPSGSDKHFEAGGSSNQGNSPADPDGGSNGGPDEPAGSGGTDRLDQDGNNGCGNDDDFEDDNNGNCGPPADQTVTPPDDDRENPPGGGGGNRPQTNRRPRVAAVQLAQPRPAPVTVAELAFTGGEVLPLALTALSLAVIGTACLALGRRRASISR